MRILIAAVVIFFASSVGAFSYYSNETLNKAATIFAMRDVSANCYSPTENGSPDLQDAWGYVDIPTSAQSFMHIDEELCNDAININDNTIDPEMRALSVLVIVHESYHLRNWGASGNEAKVECKAIRHWKYGAHFIGATNETIKELFPYALILHYRETQLFDYTTGKFPYYDPSCVVPSL